MSEPRRQRVPLRPAAVLACALALGCGGDSAGGEERSQDGAPALPSTPSPAAEDAPGTTEEGPAGGAAEITKGPVDPDARRVFESAPPRTRLGSLRSLTLRSDLVFESAPDRPHTLEFACAFPERSRLEVAGAGGRQMRYRLGENLWALDVTRVREAPVDLASRLLSDDERAAVALDLAARRALFLWPDGVSFEGDGFTRTAPVEGAGVLVATLDENEERAMEMRGFAADGRCTIRLLVDEWSSPAEHFTATGRAWPRRVRLMDGDTVVWRETLDLVEDAWFLGDPTFVPPDVFAAATGSESAAVRALEVGARDVLELPLGTSVAGTPPASVESVIDDALVAWARTDTELGPDANLAPFVDVVLDAEARPAAFRLERPAASTPGWEPHPLGFVWNQALEPGAFPTPDEVRALQGKAATSDGRRPADVTVSFRVTVHRPSPTSPPRLSTAGALVAACVGGARESTPEDGAPR